MFFFLSIHGKISFIIAPEIINWYQALFGRLFRSMKIRIWLGLRWLHALVALVCRTRAEHWGFGILRRPWIHPNGGPDIRHHNFDYPRWDDFHSLVNQQLLREVKHLIVPKNDEDCRPTYSQGLFNLLWSTRHTYYFSSPPLSFKKLS